MATNNPPSPIVRLLRLPQVLYVTGLGRTALYDLMSKNRFPRPVRLSSRAVAWRESDIVAWISERPTAVAPDSMNGGGK